MSQVKTATFESPQIPKRVSEFTRIRRIFFKRKLVVFGFVIIVLFLLTAALTQIISPYDPYLQDRYNTLAQPSGEHLLGTDALGRDLLSRIIYGSQISLMVGLVSLVIASVIGTVMGLLAGYFGGWVEMVIMRVTDMLMCFPMILLALVICALLGGGLKNVMIAVGIGLIPGYVRTVYGQVLSIKETDYILAERSIAASNLRVLLRHVLPNCLAPLLVMMTMQMGGAIMAEAGLSFLGVGISPPAAAWGSLVNDGRVYLLTNPIISIVPGICIMLVVFGFNMVGDGLRDALDPRLRGLL
ncbi:MAG: ABC transporter permease [Dehalococcoidales bacterium]|nr:ABC transporter permease [Dehalococcoidales bacterium]